MDTDQHEEMDSVLSSMWPEDINEAGKQFNVERPGADEDMLEEVNIKKEPNIVDFKRLMELANNSDKGNWQLSKLVKNWEYKQANAVRLLREELDHLSQQQEQVELKKLEILEEHRFEQDGYGDTRPISVLDENLNYLYQDVPLRRSDCVFRDEKVEVDAEYDCAVYWKKQAMRLEKLLEESLKREQILLEKLVQSIENLERQSSPVEELSQVLKRADNFLHFVLQNAPVVIGHQDKELRYRFIFNHFPSLGEEDIIGRTDVEIFSGAGVKESQEFKREVLERGLPAKREITFETELFGSKTFLIYVEPVFSKAGETIGINYMGMEVTDQVRKREKMAKLREEMAVQKAKETELNKTIHITEESMRAKQMLATMSHEIRSPLSGVVSMAEILSKTNLDKEQRHLLNVMLSSGDLVLQLINDILDLSKVESGAMKLETTKFRPREVVKHVLQTAAASLQKLLTLEGHVEDDVPMEVVGDVLRIRQILTNLVSNAIKFTHEGKVGINLYTVTEPYTVTTRGSYGVSSPDESLVASSTGRKELSVSQNNGNLEKSRHWDENGEGQADSEERVVWIRCDVYDTGIGIPETAIPTLFKKYMQVGTDTARKYGGTGLGLAICKQLVELMGGHLTVSSVEHRGSTFTFLLPYKVSSISDHSEDLDEISDIYHQDILGEPNDDDLHSGIFLFQPQSSFSSQSPERIHKLSSSSNGVKASHKCNGILESCSYPSSSITYKAIPLEEDVNSAVHPMETSCQFSSQSPKRIHKLSSSSNGVKASHKCNGILESCSSPSSSITYKAIPLEKDVNSAAHPMETSCEPDVIPSMENLEKQKQLYYDESDYKDLDENSETNTAQVTYQTSGSSECSCSNSSESVKAEMKPRILLVEDNKINVMVTTSMMKQLGHDLDIACSGAEAVRAVQCCNYDLILMDVCMPVMDGLQATRCIRFFEKTGCWDEALKAGVKMQLSSPHCWPNSQLEKPRKRIPIIAMTANALSESADECFASGMDSFMSKPVTLHNLRQCIEKYL